jgi:hypothetical protein
MHLEIEGIDGEMILWRYMDIAKFVSMLEQNAIWLARADTFGDKYEGRFPDEMREYIENAYEAYDDEDDDSPVNDASDFQDYLVKNTFISCWHHNLEENMVMWEIYGKETNAIAIQTTAKSIVNSIDTSFISGYSLKMKNVEYKNANEISGILRYEDSFFRKRKHFSFEKEVRISLDTYNRSNPTKKSKRGRRDFKLTSCEKVANLIQPVTKKARELLCRDVQGYTCQSYPTISFKEAITEKPAS